MPTWATVAIALGGPLVGAVIGGAFALAGTRVQLQHQRTEREAADRRELTQRGAAALGPVLSLLRDARPDPIAVSSGPHSPAIVQELRDRWSTMRDEIEVFAAVQPSPEISGQVDRLIVAVSNALISLGWLVHDSPRSITPEARQQANQDHLEAQQKAHDLVRELHESPGSTPALPGDPRRAPGSPRMSVTP
jgi:hypothetical protein